MGIAKDKQKSTNRPGGFELTERALSFCQFNKGANILDIGCGCGATVDFLRQNNQFETVGIDKSLEIEFTDKILIKASAEQLPFPEKSLDGVIMECSFSLTDNQKSVLQECYRTLKTDGYLIITDMYARGEPAHLKGCLGKIESKQTL
ncbi:MAG: class I SAM-dependent methyltransferase [Chloroflexia bacterium]|nr:class I SAM-dependent methyltransferase [Chloroflexia bacterium]